MAAEVATEVVDRLSKLVLDSYIETDEDIGPRVAKFDLAHSQLQLIGEQLTSMRDAASATHEAHMQLVSLASAGESTIPSIQAFGERQESLAGITQSLAARYERFVNLSVNQLEGLAMVVSNKYQAYTAKVVEMRKRKQQLQLLVRQKERSDLRTLERSLIPTSPGGGSFHTDLEGPLLKLSSTTRLWWTCYARLDLKRKVLLFTTRQSEPPSAASKAVALSKYVLCHELPEHHARRAAAFELVPAHPELPSITLAADGTMVSRQWCCALQQAIDHMPEGDESGEAPTMGAPAEAATSGADGAPSAALAATPPAGTNGGSTLTPASGASAGSPLTPLSSRLEAMVDYSSAKWDELDRHFSGTLAEQSQRTELQLQQLTDERQVVAENVCHAIDAFGAQMHVQMSEELLLIAEAQLEYHSGMATQMQTLVGTLKARHSAACAAAADANGGASAASAAGGAAGTTGAAMGAAPAIEASLAPVEVSEPHRTPGDAAAAEEETEAVYQSEAPAPTTVPAPSSGGLPATATATQGELDEIID